MKKRADRECPAAANTGGAYATPLRYPGGKGPLGPWFAEVLEYNGLKGGWYVEPYAGGAGAALYLLTQGCVEHVVINDADPVIYAFWKAATDHSHDLIRKIRATPLTMQSWMAQKLVLETPEAHDVVDLGFAAFFLNRTNRSGILSAGVIGGQAQAGPWRLDARFNKDVLCERIEKIGSLRESITVLGLDAVDLLIGAAPGFPSKCLVYLDPPYYVKGSVLYRNHYHPADHAAVADCVVRANYPIVVTYDECPEVRNLYKDLDCASFSLHYSTHSARPLSTEVMFYANLELPVGPRMTRGFRFGR